MASRRALLVGTRDYSDPYFSSVRATHADLCALESVLLSPQIGGFDSVNKLFNASCLEVRVALAEMLGRASSSDLLLLYFTGHGMLDEQGRLYLCMRDTRRDVLRATGLAASAIRDEMDACRSKTQLLILDCCHSGAFARDGKGASVGTNVGTRASFEGNGLGRVVLTASDATQLAFEGDKVAGTSEKSLFTHYLVDGLQTGHADTDGDGLVSVTELYNYVHDHVVRDAPEQTPGKWTYKQHGEIHLAKNPHPVPLHDLIDRELRDSIAEGKPIKVREAALREIIALSANQRPGIALAARSLLHAMARDDSRTLSALAAEALDGGTRSADAPRDGAALEGRRQPRLLGSEPVTRSLPKSENSPIATFPPLSLAPKPPSAGLGRRSRRSTALTRSWLLALASLPLCAAAAATVFHVSEQEREAHVTAEPRNVEATPRVVEEPKLPQGGDRGPKQARSSASGANQTARPAPDSVTLQPSVIDHGILPPVDVSGTPAIVEVRAPNPEAAQPQLPVPPKPPAKPEVYVHVTRGELQVAVLTRLRRDLTGCEMSRADSGTVTFRFDVDSDGRVIRAERHQETPLRSALIACLARVIKETRVTPSASPAVGVTLQVTIQPRA